MKLELGLWDRTEKGEEVRIKCSSSSPKEEHVETRASSYLQGNVQDRPTEKILPQSEDVPSHGSFLAERSSGFSSSPKRSGREPRLYQ